MIIFPELKEKSIAYIDEGFAPCNGAFNNDKNEDKLPIVGLQKEHDDKNV